MKTCCAIIDGPITPGDEQRVAHGAGWPHRLGDHGVTGAVLRFEGVVRRMEPSAGNTPALHELLALDYSTYDPMALEQLEALARGVLERHGLNSVLALHSRGRVDVGMVSFVLELTAPHRAETLAAAADFIDRMKRDVPIWKTPIWKR